MSFWKCIRQTIELSFLKFSLFSTSFIVSLFIGTALYHPVLGPLPQLIAYAQVIVISSIVLALANQLSSISPPPTVYMAPRRRKTYYTH